LPCDRYHKVCGQPSKDIKLSPLKGPKHLWRRTVQKARVSELASEELSSCVSLNPLEAPQNALSVLDTLNDGDAVVYVPSLEPSTAAETAGRCIKTKFFEFAFQRANKVRPFFYIVDEAHRFISSGQQDGEQSLLDRCRAYRTGVVMATQSHASLAMRLEGSFGGRHALDIILNNCGNSLYFRTPDIHTQNNLRDRIPEAPIAGRMHVVKVRPLASLNRGSARHRALG
jgi:hypothetical protein